MMGDPLLSVFPPALLRLILCGGGGLPAAWGPLVLPDGQIDVWAGVHAIATGNCGEPGFWSFSAADKPWRLPLDHWRARLAIVAAWMLSDVDVLAAAAVSRPTGLSLWVWSKGDKGADPPDPTCYRWALDGEADAGGGSFYDLPTLPAHLLTHDPAVALLLSLFEMPEIRAKVEALNE